MGMQVQPPEDVGGVSSYFTHHQDLENPEDPKYKAVLNHIGGEFEPQEFGLE